MPIYLFRNRFAVCMQNIEKNEHYITKHIFGDISGEQMQTLEAEHES